MTKKLLFLTTDFSGGGAENVLVQLANYFSLNYEVHYIVLSNKGPNLSKLNSSIKLFVLNKKSSISSVFKINKYIRKKNIDVAIGTLSMAYAVSLAKLFGNKKCIYIARLGSIISSNLSEYKLIKKLIMYFYQKTLNFSDKIITQSVAMDNDLKKYTKKKSTIIYNPISRDRILSLAKENSDIKLDSNFYNIISVGRLASEKDYKSAILSISKLKNKIENIRYYILGEGDLKEELIEYSKSLGMSKEIIFLGYLKNPFPVMKSADVLLLTSLYEGFSNVILESLTLNVPVVATNSPGGNKEIVSDGMNGFLAKVKDSDDIVDKLLKVNQQKKYEIDVSKFDINIISKEYEKHFS